MIGVALRSARTHLGQFLLTTLAVVLGVTFLSGTLALRGVLSEAFSSLTSSTLTADLYVRGAEVSPEDEQGTTAMSTRIDSALAGRVAAIDGVSAALPYAAVPVTLVGADSTPVVTTGAPSIAIPLYPEGYDASIVSGRRPQAEGEVSLESEALERSGLAMGDTTRLVIDGDPLEVTVVGEFSYGSPMAGATVVGMSPEWLMPLAAPDGLVTEISVHLADGASAEAVRAQIEPLLPEGTRIQNRAEVIEEESAQIEDILGYIQTFLLVFVVLAMVVGSFIIMNTFAISVRQRQREFALLRAVGASPLSVFATVLLQAVVVGLIGSILGVGCGAGLTRLIMVLLEGAGMPLPRTITMSTGVAVISVVVGLLVTVIGALVPSRRAALTPPVEAMRETSGAKEKSLAVRTVIGAALCTAGLICVLAAWHVDSLPRRGPLLGVGAAVLLLGLLLASPALSRSVVTVLGMPLRLIRPGGRLAARNLVTAPRRTAATSAALVIGMALVCAGTIVAASTRASVEEIVNDSMRADFLVRQSTAGTTPLPTPLVEQIALVEGVASTTGYLSEVVTVTGADGASTTGYAAVVDPGPYLQSYDPEVTQGSFEDLDDAHIAAVEGSGLEMGEQVVLTGAADSVTATVVALVKAEGITATVYVPAEVIARTGALTGHVPAEHLQVLDSPHGLFVTLEEGASAAAVQEEIEAIVAPAHVFSVLDREQLTDQIGAESSRMLTILYGLLGLSIVIAVLGIVNTLILSVSERTREIGVMRAVGLGRAQLMGQIVSESVLTTVYGTVLGALTGLILSGALRALLADTGLRVLVIPWAQLAVLLLIAVVVGVLAALWPALRASRMPVLEAIASE